MVEVIGYNGFDVFMYLGGYIVCDCYGNVIGLLMVDLLGLIFYKILVWILKFFYEE